MKFRIGENETYSVKRISKEMALKRYEEILSIINLIPYIQSNKNELFEERNSQYSKWEYSVGVFNSNNEIIGVLLAYYRKKDDRHNFDSLYIHRFAVKKEYQKRSIGTKLVTFFLKANFCSKQSLDLVSIQTNMESRNQHVIDFYRDIGFQDRYLIQYPDKVDVLMTISRKKYLATLF